MSRPLSTRVAGSARRLGPRATRPSTCVCRAQGVLILPGLGNNSEDYADLSALLETRGFDPECATVKRIDWARNAAGLRYATYWTGKLNPRPTVDWYLDRVTTGFEALSSRSDDDITLLTHSAGGWLGRLYLASLSEEQRSRIKRFVSLGSPHLPPPAGVVDQTRGILKFMSDTVPGAWHDDVAYVTIAGKWLQGAGVRDDAPMRAKVVGTGYQQVCGAADVWGDGVVPVLSAHLEGAEQVDLLGVYHSPIGATPARPWYGSEEVLGRWVHHLDGSEPAAGESEPPADVQTGSDAAEPDPAAAQ